MRHLHGCFTAQVMEKGVLGENALELGDAKSSEMLAALEQFLGKHPVCKDASSSASYES